MRSFRLRHILVSIAFCAGWTFQAIASPTSASMVPRSMGFEENQGQAPPNVRFIQRAAGYTVLALDHGLDLQLKASGEHPPSLHMEFAGAGLAPRVSAQEPLTGRVNYLRGNNPAAWRRNIPTFTRVQYDDLYPGIAASFYSKGGQLEYDVVLQPQADLSVVKLRFSSAGEATRPTLTSEGDLLLGSNAGELRLHKPVVYQLSEAKTKQFVAGRFVLRSTNEVGFSVPVYDRTKPLIVDPVVTYSSYFGGSGGDGIASVKRDKEGNIYIAGYTASPDFPNTSAVQTFFGGAGDAFVSKLDPTGMHLIYTTYLGGSGFDDCSALDVASDGSTSLAGYTNSANFPTINAVQTTLKGVYSAFVAHLDNSGSQLIFSTYLGGTSGADASGLALGPDMSVYVTGRTSSLDFPVTKGAIKSICEANLTLNSCDGDAFVTRLSPGGQLIYSTLLGGSNVDSASGIAVDTQGQAYVTGTTSSDDFPLKRAAQREKKGGTSAFLSRVSADGTQLIFSTYFGGSGNLQTTGMALDQWRNIYLTGYIVLDELQRLPPPELPLLNPFQPHPGGRINRWLHCQI